MRRRLVLLACLAGAALVVGGGASASVGASAHAAKTVTVSHAPTGFSAKVPPGYRLKVVGGAYRITGGGLTVTVRVVATAKGARAYGLTQRRRGDTTVSSSGNKNRFRLASNGKGQRRVVLVVRRGANLIVSTSLRPIGRPGLGPVADRIAASVRGGTPRAVATPGAGAPATPGTPSGRLMPLTPYRAPDGGATAWVPSDPDWTISSSQGALEGSSPRGNFLFGQTFSIVLPGAAPGPLPSTSVVAPFMSAAQALQTVWPLINQGAGIPMTNVRIRSVLADATLPTFRSSGMMLFDYTINGRSYAGVANVGVEDRLSSYSNFFWQMYISVIGVPADGDPTVGAALRLVWRSWNPSGAIAQRNTQARQILNEINDIWKGVAEFRSRTADQQSRDVSCLLRTGPFIDDNARALGLPPLLDCDSTYVRTS